MRERVGDAQGAGEADGGVARWDARAVDPLHRDAPAERLEQLGDEILGAPHGDGRDDDLERDRRVGQRLPLLRAPGHCRAERAHQRHRQEGRGGIRPIVYVAVEQPVAVAAPAHQADGVDVEDQRGLAAGVGRLGEEHGGATEGELDLVQALGMLGEEVAEVGSRLVGRGNGEKHRPVFWAMGRQQARTRGAIRLLPL